MSNLKNTSYLFGSNAAFIQELYNQFIQDQSSVDSEWQSYFNSLGDDKIAVTDSVKGAPWKPKENTVIGVLSREETEKMQKSAKVANTGVASAEDLQNSIRAANLMNAFRTYGHTDVNLDPLGLTRIPYHPELDYKAHGFSEADLDKTVFMGGFFGVEQAPLRDVLHVLKQTYAGRVGTEFMHIESAEERKWFMRKLESTAGTVSITEEEKLKALKDVTEAEMFESYLHTKFPGTKRFSVEGLENCISAIEVFVHNSVSFGVREFILGMAHRGRLNTLTKVMGKPYRSMLSEFKGELAFPKELGIPGDVKYHLGASTDITIDGHKVHMTLTPNPSHLEVVNPVVLGKVRAKQDLRDDFSRSSVVGILLHGDAAFAGQGTVMETLALSQLEAYHTGGTIHIVTNNQIGFTTTPKDSRSTTYATDIAKFIGAPILHVNGDDAEAVVYAAKLASEYRATFKKDVVLDVVGYRKYGHNEGDEPFFTNPVMYNAIKSKKNPAEVYAEKLISEALISQDEYASMRATFKSHLDKEFELSQEYKPKKADWLEGNWSKFNVANKERSEPKTGIEIKKIRKIGLKLCEYPKDFNINPKIARQLDARREMMESGKNLDWAAGEALAFSTLLSEGHPVRITGQDAKRGTFSHRHAVLFDQTNDSQFSAFNNLGDLQKARFEVANSNLSEFGVLGFEYGYSFTHPNALTIWEAQFGDFANGAQVIIDQYISSAEAKWLRMSGITLLLPHGYEGQGPEHSSARLERFLQLCAMDNMQVANCTTPASLFHILRRQLHRDFRKPLVIMSPKSLLRHKLAVSNLSEFDKGTSFEPVIGETDSNVKAKDVKRVYLCSGKVYYDLFEKRAELKKYDVALVRLEQLYPFPKEQLAKVLKQFPNADVAWVQEEHKNMGAYFFVEHRIEQTLESINHKCKRPIYIGRETSASPAVGYMKLHTQELQKLMTDAFGK